MTVRHPLRRGPLAPERVPSSSASHARGRKAAARIPALAVKAALQPGLSAGARSCVLAVSLVYDVTLIAIAQSAGGGSGQIDEKDRRRCRTPGGSWRMP
jgi:hypothetical protein